MKLRGVPKGPLSSPKVLKFFVKGGEIVFAILFWFSRSLDGAREEHTQDCYFQLLVPKCEFRCDLELMFNLDL
jgi:hypothetical protein